MMKRHQSLYICLLFSYLLGVASAVGQQQPVLASELQPLPVYVVNFRQSDPIREIGDLGTFATSLIDLRLLEVPSLTVHQVSDPPTCESASPQKAAQSQLSSTSLPSTDYYVVRGSIEVRLPEIVLDYFVEKCEKQTLHRMLEDTQPFTLDHAREELTVAAHAIAYKIERATPPTQVTLEPFEVEGDVPDNDEMQKTIQREVAEELSKSPSLEVSDAGDYKIGGKITFQKNASLFRPFAKATVQAELHIKAPARNYPIGTFNGSPDTLPGQIVTKVQYFLPQVLLAEHLGLPEIQGNMQVDELLTRGSQLIEQCSADGHTCETAQDATRLLISAIQQNDRMWKAFWLLGQAQMLTWKYADAATSLERASSLAKQDADSGKVIAASDRARILALLGDADRSIEKYDLANAAYDQSLAFLPSQPHVYANKALALRLGGDRLASLQVILDGIKSYPENAQPLREQAKDVIRVLQKGEFDKAENLFADANRAGVEVRNEYALVLSRKWEQILDTSWTPDNRTQSRQALERALSLQPSDPDILAEVSLNLARAELWDGDREKLQALVATVEKLPADQVTANHREWAERIKARDQLDHAEFDAAATSASAALRILSTDDANFLLSTAYLFLGQQKEKAAGSATQEVKSLYRQSADLAASLVVKRYTNADTALVMARHHLGEDRKTRDEFERLVKLNPVDVSALNGLMFVCSQYQIDAPCAFSAAQKIADQSDQHGPDASSNFLNIAEVAVLTSNDQKALSWLDVAAQQPQLGPRNESLVHFYRLWIDIRQGQAQESSSEFQAWREATVRFRNTHDLLHWIFDGVKKTLSREKLAGGSEALLLEMTEALEDNNKPLPTWPKFVSTTMSNFN